jgi:RNA-directed DNA polymerase
VPPENVNPSLVELCAAATGLARSEVLSIARTGPKRYKIYQLNKRSGGTRTICHPSRELKALQYVFLNEILPNLPVHRCATAYKRHSSIRYNAEIHKESRVILKLDFLTFFNSIKTEDWIRYARSVFPNWSQEDLGFSAYVLFWGEGGYLPRCLAIGAPTSPLLSNALMYQFDGIIDEYAERNAMRYSRYADDLTFSSRAFLDKAAVIALVIQALRQIEHPRLTLNEQKTRLASKATMRQVTGLILTNEGHVSLGRPRKRLLISMVHHALTGQLDEISLIKLRGLLAFAHDAEPTFLAALARKYGSDRVDAVRGKKSD